MLWPISILMLIRHHLRGFRHAFSLRPALRATVVAFGVSASGLMGCSAPGSDGGEPLPTGKADLQASAPSVVLVRVPIPTERGLAGLDDATRAVLETAYARPPSRPDEMRGVSAARVALCDNSATRCAAARRIAESWMRRRAGWLVAEVALSAAPQGAAVGGAGLIAWPLTALAIFVGVGNELVTTDERVLLESWSLGTPTRGGRCRQRIRAFDDDVEVCPEQAREILAEAGLLEEAAGGGVIGYYPRFVGGEPRKAEDCATQEPVREGFRANCFAMEEIVAVLNGLSVAPGRPVHEFTDLQGNKWGAYLREDGGLKFFARDAAGNEVPWDLLDAYHDLIPDLAMANANRAWRGEALVAALRQAFAHVSSDDPEVFKYVLGWLYAALQLLADSGARPSMASIAGFYATLLYDLSPERALADAIGLVAAALQSPEIMGSPEAMRATLESFMKLLNDARYVDNPALQAWFDYVESQVVARLVPAG